MKSYLDPLVFKLELDVQRITVGLLVLSLWNLDKSHIKVNNKKQLFKFTLLDGGGQANYVQITLWS